MKARLEYRDEGSSKFWEVEVTGATVTTRWGKIGSKGQRKAKTHPSAATAQAQAKKAMASKLAKGYVANSATKTKAKTKRTTSSKTWLPCVLPLEGDAAAACKAALERAAAVAASDREARLRRELLEIVASIAGDRRPRWLSIDDSEDTANTLAIDLSAPLCWARSSDGDEFYSSWNETYDGPRLVLQSRRRPWRAYVLEEDAEEDEGEVVLGNADVARVTDFDPEATMVYSIEFAGSTPRTLAELARKATGLERCCGHDIDVLELETATIPTRGAPSPHGNERGEGRRGAYATTGPAAKPSLSWRSRTRNGSSGGGSEFGAQPLIIDRLILSSGFSCLSAVNRRGKTVWESARLPGGDAFVGALASFEDCVLAATFRTITAFDLASGKPRWSRKIRNPQEGVVCDGHLAYVGAGNSLLALDPRSGKTAWSWSPGKKAKAVGAPVLAEDRMFVLVDDRVFALTHTGDEPEVSWQAEGNRYRISRYGMVVGDAVYVATTRGIAAYEAQTGKRRWKVSGPARNLALDSEAGIVLATADPSLDRTLWGIDASTGKVKYERKKGYGVPSIADGVCYMTLTYANDSTGLVALDVRKGTQRWSLSPKDVAASVKRGYVPEVWDSSVALPLDGKLLVGVDGLWAFG